MPVLFHKIDYVIIAVSDMARSVEFYCDRLGIPLRFESPGWSEFETGVTTLALHISHGKANAPSEELIVGTASIGFQVDNLNETYENLRSKGVVFAMPPTAREEEGIKLAVCLDPDGLSISLAERQKSA